MKIQNMFHDDINRKINGVIQVDQDTADVIEQEVKEYIITKELKVHFSTFFNNYTDAFEHPTADIGVWISGFFGSGKSHFLKMLSYILENKAIGESTTVEMFRRKFEDDPAISRQIERATKGETETILFNIDVEASIKKDKTAVMRVFAKMFYNHLGFYGENLKVAMLEYYLGQIGKTEEFHRVFEEKRGQSWVGTRRAFAFNGRFIIPTLMEVLDMSEEDAGKWFADKTETELSIAQLVSDIKDYVDSKPEGFRLLFMIDEVGQYVGTDTDMLLNLQSLTEKLGSECLGKVWVICTGQEAIDEIIKVRTDEFSRIQARFRTRLSLSSSSVDEVIQRRILKKTDGAEKLLTKVYEQNDYVLKNLFTFKGAQLDIRGFGTSSDFVINFPFVPYQFIIMQKVFAEIRKHGNSGKHFSGGERSMLSGFQEAAQKIQQRDEYAIAPFFLFYDTVHSFLDGSIRRVIERCARAAVAGDAGIEDTDVDVLKLLYLVRYIDNDVPANLDNIVILMADDIRVDKIELRKKVSGSLERLHSQNYIARTGDIYNFLTDEEQDIQRAIRNEISVDTAAIVDRIAQLIFSDIYPTRKFRFGKYDFAFEAMVDGVNFGTPTGGMKLRFLTVATEASEKTNERLMMDSYGQAVAVLADTDYYSSLEQAMKIRKYVKQRNVRELPKSIQDIIRQRQDEATLLEADTKEELKKAIMGARFYIAGEYAPIKGSDPKAKIDQALELLVSHVYSSLDLIDKNAENDDDIRAILLGEEAAHSGTESNRGAVAKMEEYLEIQHKKKLPTSMADVQARFGAIPYGWREIDIAAVAARLIYEQKVTIKYAGNTIQPNDPRLPDMLRKKSEIAKTSISKREIVSLSRLKEAREFLSEYFDVMDVPRDEDGLIAFIIERFTQQKIHYEELDARYTNGNKYPDHALIDEALKLTADILSQQKDNIALVDRVIKRADDLFEIKERMSKVESFFKTQVGIFDAAIELQNALRHELDYLSHEEEANAALNEIRLICLVQPDEKFDYSRIPKLNALMDKVHFGYDRLLKAKREEILEYVRQCTEVILTVATDVNDNKSIVHAADNFYAQKKQQIEELRSLALLDGLIPPMLQYEDAAVQKLEALKEKPVVLAKPVELPRSPVNGVKEGNLQPPGPPQPKKVYKTLNRSIVFPAKTLESEAEIDTYVEKMRGTLKQLLKNCDGIRLK